MTDANQSVNASGIGVLPDQEGVILQRGGEELAIEKMDDRFTVRLINNSPDALAALVQQLQVNAAQPVPSVDLVELLVDAAGLDAAMERARNSPEVAFASHVYRLQSSRETLVYLTDQITIQFTDRVDKATVVAEIAALGLQAIQTVEGIPQTFVFRLTIHSTVNPIKLANQLMRRADVLTAEPNIVIRSQLHYRPKDSLYPQQWHLNHDGGDDLAVGSHIFAEAAWDMTRGVRSIVVAVADDAMDLNHPDLQGKGKIVAPIDLKGGDTAPLPGADSENHGTACAGVAVAEENGEGVVGVAPGCSLMPIRTTGFLDDGAIERVFNWAIDNGASVISCSWGPSAIYFPLSLRQRAVLTKAASQGRGGKGCVIIFAAGNANRPVSGAVNEQGWANNVLSGPTNWLNGFGVHPDVITVAACTSLSKKAAYSNWGTNISVAAPSNNAPPGLWLQQTGYTYTAPAIRSFLPGKAIVTDDRLGSAGYDPSSYTSSFGGTSSACPVVAGVAALILSANPDLTAQDVRQILQTTADKLVDPQPDPQLGLQKGTYDVNGHSQWFGYGKVNAARAVQAARQRIAPPPAVSRQIQQQNSTAIDIPDYNPQGATSFIQINDTSVIRAVQVSVDVEHSFLGDIEISFIAPSGQTVLLQNRTLGRSTKLQATYSLQTTPALRQLINQPASGRWQLRLVDYALLNTGRLRSWQLVFGV